MTLPVNLWSEKRRLLLKHKHGTVGDVNYQWRSHIHVKRGHHLVFGTLPNGPQGEWQKLSGGLIPEEGFWVADLAELYPAETSLPNWWRPQLSEAVKKWRKRDLLEARRVAEVNWSRQSNTMEGS